VVVAALASTTETNVPRGQWPPARNHDLIPITLRFARGRFASL
jgi:hypothetical protein